jgi:hypothetical protein
VADDAKSVTRQVEHATAYADSCPLRDPATRSDPGPHGARRDRKKHDGPSCATTAHPVPRGSGPLQAREESPRDSNALLGEDHVRSQMVAVSMGWRAASGSI